MIGILIDTETGDLLIEHCAVVIGDSEVQTAEIVVRSMRGDLKEHPLLGGEAENLRGGCMDVMWPGEVRRMLRWCGVDCERVRVDNDGIITIER